MRGGGSVVGSVGGCVGGRVRNAGTDGIPGCVGGRGRAEGMPALGGVVVGRPRVVGGCCPQPGCVCSDVAHVPPVATGGASGSGSGATGSGFAGVDAASRWRSAATVEDPADAGGVVASFARAVYDGAAGTVGRSCGVGTSCGLVGGGVRAGGGTTAAGWVVLVDGVRGRVAGSAGGVGGGGVAGAAVPDGWGTAEGFPSARGGIGGGPGRGGRDAPFDTLPEVNRRKRSVASVATAR